MEKRLVLIDGYAMLHRAYHAFPISLTTRNGEVVNAVYGFTKMLLSVIADLSPKCLAVAFDTPKPTFRHKEFIGYQAQRPKMDTQMEDQLNRVHQVLRALNIPIFAVEGFEADDVIGTLAKQAKKKKMETIIVTGDRDIMQLVAGRIKVYVPAKGISSAKIFEEKEVEESLGVRPQQVVDYKAMVGDASDNYPGVPGVGPKTASFLLQQYGDLENIYRNLGKIKPVLAEKLKKGRESGELSKKLATIAQNVPIKLDLKACLVRDYDRQKAVKLFEELEFRSLVDKLPGAEKEEEKKEDKQMKLI